MQVSRRVLVLAGLATLLVLAGCSAAPTAGVDPGDLSNDSRADPDTDVIGWEGGYWHNESLDIDQSDGLNSAERTALIRRAMARVEYVRSVEFDESVTVEVISREQFRSDGAGAGDQSEAFRQFDNAKFEALFLVGEQEDSVDTQEGNRGSTVLGYYSPGKDRIVIVAESDTPAIAEVTLAHELVHAYQFRHFDPSYNRSTRELYNARNALIEGDARYVDIRYRDRCGDEWECSSPPSTGGGGSGSAANIHFGVYALNYFPYSDGPGFIEHFRERGGWERVEQLYAAPPNSTEQVITPEKYGRDEPSDVTLRDRSGDEWERVRPPNRLDFAELGQSGVASMFGYTVWAQQDTGNDPVVSTDQWFNFAADGGIDRSDPFNYNLSYAGGWDGDRLHAYSRGEETAYVWRLAWDSPAEAREFAAGYRELLQFWGAERVRDGVWRIPDGEFEDAYALRVNGDTVTVVNAPSVEELDAVHDAG